MLLAAVKTKVYMKLIDEVMKTNRGIIVLIPEISLTPQMLSLFMNVMAVRLQYFIVHFQWVNALMNGRELGAVMHKLQLELVLLYSRPLMT